MTITFTPHTCELPALHRGPETVRRRLSESRYLSAQESYREYCVLEDAYDVFWGRGAYFRRYTGGAWGPGVGPADVTADHFEETYHDGIYVASNLPNTTAVYGSLVKNPAKFCGRHGSLEGFRSACGSRALVGANELVWLTDRTPHESLPMSQGGYRQFFRVVAGDVNVWWADHSTSNPAIDWHHFAQAHQHGRGPTIVYGSKFDN